MTVTTPSRVGEPAWELADVLLPEQGRCSERDYLRLPTNRLVEFVDGVLEFPPVPTLDHQRLAAWVYRALFAFVTDGEVFFSPCRLRVAPRRFREPDVMAVLGGNRARLRPDHAEAADLVVEVVSADDPGRDWVTKRVEYAAAGVPEYWIVDPLQGVVAVLTLPPGTGEYVEAGRHGAGQQAPSLVLPGFTADVTALFAAAIDDPSAPAVPPPLQPLAAAPRLDT